MQGQFILWSDIPLQIRKYCNEDFLKFIVNNLKIYTHFSIKYIDFFASMMSKVAFFMLYEVNGNLYNSALLSWRADQTQKS